MTWYDANYKRRQHVTVLAFGGAGSKIAVDVTIAFPDDWAGFWDNIRSDFKDVIPVDAFGNLLEFQRTSANYNNKTLTIKVKGLSAFDDAATSIFIYYGNPNETVDHSASLTFPNSPKLGRILLSAPHSRIVSPKVSGDLTANPLQTFTKATFEEIHVFFKISSEIAKRIESYNNRNSLEEIEYFYISALNSSGSEVSSLYTETETRIGNGFIRATFKGGTNNTTYAIVIKYITTLGQKLESRALLRVTDTLPD